MRTNFDSKKGECFSLPGFEIAFWFTTYLVTLESTLSVKENHYYIYQQCCFLYKEGSHEESIDNNPQFGTYSIEGFL